MTRTHLHGRVAGSEKKVVEEARAADAARAKEDEEWRQKLAVAAMTTRPKVLPVGDVPADPKAANIFPNFTVFRQPQLYLRQNSAEYIYRNGNPAGVFNTHTHWHFLTNGRVWCKSISYVGATQAKERQSPAGTYYIDSVQEIKKWGRYRVENDEQLVIEMDDGEMVPAKLIDGRRNLQWGETTYGNVLWGQEALKRYLEKQK